MLKSLKLLFLSLIALAAAVPAVAGPKWTEYDAAGFARLQAEGRTIVVDVHAEWCPTCRAQQPILDTLRKDDRLADAVFVKVDFDTDKEFLRAHRVPRQSTILVFRGRKETARSIAETRPAQLRAAVIAGI